MSHLPPPSMREEYLRKIWSRQPYPVAHKSASQTTDIANIFISQGRLVDFSADHMTLHRMEGPRTFKMKPGLEITPGFPWDQCVMAGDILEVKGQRGNSDGVQGAASGDVPWDTMGQVDAVRILVPSRRPNPLGAPTFDVKRARQWQDYMASVRGFFVEKDFVELRTPTLVPSPGLEPYLDPFETVFHWGRGTRRFYLPTSPEFHLKKALTLGFEKCFEFKECFRNGELSEHHQPEFLMLEWYRAYEDNQALIADVDQLLRHVQRASGAAEVFPVKVIMMEDLWLQCLNYPLTPQTTVEELRSLAGKVAVDFDPDENFDDLFARLFLEKIEKFLAALPEPVIVHHYPPSQAALSRITADGWADRFELYWRGLEIANAFHELNDPAEQRRRFSKDQEKKRQLGKAVVPVDEEFLQALEWGMPPSAGIALGVERLFMALHGIKNLSQVRLFSMKEND